jgi:hypothetical protein
MAVANALTYLNTAKIMVVKRLKVESPDVNVADLFSSSVKKMEK